MSKREGKIPYAISHMWNLKCVANKPIYLEKRNRFTDTEKRLVLPRRGGSGIQWECGGGRCKLLHLEWISNEGPTV